MKLLGDLGGCLVETDRGTEGKLSKPTGVPIDCNWLPTTPITHGLRYD